jgi:hypothetical protein
MVTIGEQLRARKHINRLRAVSFEPFNFTKFLLRNEKD